MFVLIVSWSINTSTRLGFMELSTLGNVYILTPLPSAKPNSCCILGSTSSNTQLCEDTARRGLAKLQLLVAPHCKTHLHLPHNVLSLPGQSDFRVFCIQILQVSVTTVLHNWSVFLPCRLGDSVCQDDLAEVTMTWMFKELLLMSLLKAEVNCYKINERLISYWLQ